MPSVKRIFDELTLIVLREAGQWLYDKKINIHQLRDEKTLQHGEEIAPGEIEFYSDPAATEIYYQEIVKMLHNGDLLPIEGVDKNIMKPLQNQLVNEVYTMCKRRMNFISFQD